MPQHVMVMDGQCSVGLGPATTTTIGGVPMRPLSILYAASTAASSVGSFATMLYNLPRYSAFAVEISLQVRLAVTTTPITFGVDFFHPVHPYDTLGLTQRDGTCSMVIPANTAAHITQDTVHRCRLVFTGGSLTSNSTFNQLGNQLLFNGSSSLPSTMPVRFVLRATAPVPALAIHGGQFVILPLRDTTSGAYTIP